MEAKGKFTTIDPFKLESAALEGQRLLLEPLDELHIKDLLPLLDPDTFEWYTVKIHDGETLRQYMRQILSEQQAGRSLAFAIREKISGRLIGSSRFLNVDPRNRRLEIGSTWYARSWQRTFANTEAKFLMLSHAFDKLSCICVQFQTDMFNVRSRTAIERLGAKLDGIIRCQRICYNGRIRDTACYSITFEDWPGVRNQLTRLMAFRPDVR